MTGTDWVTLLWWIGGGVFALAGLALLIIALLGDWFFTRKTRPRHCPKCWYNLSGTESRTCSECGYEAKVERSLYKPRRRWRWAFIALLLIIAGGGAIGWQQTRGYDWNRIKPVWLLKREGHGLGARAYAARSELVRRIGDESLSQQTINALYDHAMALQADPDYPWMDTTNWRATLNTWGDIVETAHDMEAITAEQLAAYLEQAFRPHIKLVTRPKWRERVPIQVHYEYAWPRAAGQPRWQAARLQRLNAVGFLDELRISGQDVGTDWTLGLQSGFGNSPPGLSNQFDVVAEFEVGGVAIESNWTVDVVAGERLIAPIREAYTNPPRNWPVPTLHASWKMQLDSHFEIVSADEPTVTMVPDPSMKNQIRDALAISLTETRIGQSGRLGKYGIITVDTLPVNLSFDVFCRSNDEEHLVGTLISRKGIAYPVTGSMIDIANPNALFPRENAVDVILRASPMPAEHTIDIFEAWDGEIIIEDVPLRELPKGTITGERPDS